MSDVALDDQFLFDAAPCGLLVTDTDDVIRRVNQTFLTWTGYDRDDVIGRPFQLLLDSGSQAFYGTQYQDELWSRDELREITLRLVRSDGSLLPALLNARLMPGERAPLGVHLAVFDSSRREDFERELLTAKRHAEDSEASVRMLQTAATLFLAAGDRFELATSLAQVAREAFAAQDTAVVEYDHDGVNFHVIHGEHLRSTLDAVRASRPPGARALGPDETVLISTLDEAFARSEEVGRRLREARAAAFSAVSIVDGDTVLGAVASLYGRPRRFEPALIDLHRALARQAGLAFSRVRLQERLRYMASHDQLTLASNRAAIDERADRELEAARRDGHSLSLIFLDLDGFKAINDQLGHRAGDVVLKAVAQRLQRCVRDTDAVGRFGGDEFLVVCPHADSAAAQDVARRIVEAIAAPIDGLPGSHGVTASVGVSTYDPLGLLAPQGDLSAESMTRLADAAMYEAKRLGKGRVSVSR